MGDESKADLDADGDSKPVSVLLVDDNEANVMVAEAYLVMHGHQVTVARDGCAGVKAFANGHFDIVLMDIQMPRMDGYEATRQIRSAVGDDTVPIVAISAGRSGVTAGKALEAGMNAFVSKPVDWAELMDVIASEVIRARQDADGG